MSANSRTLLAELGQLFIGVSAVRYLMKQRALMNKRAEAEVTAVNDAPMNLH